MIDLESLGQLGLFISSFLAASFFPIGCEAIFIALLLGVSGLSDAHFHFTVLNATVGNTLGAVMTYFIGAYLPLEKALNFLKIKYSRFNQIKLFVAKKAKLMALFAWLPILGDPIALALGHVRANIFAIAPMMALGKYLRFFVLGVVGVHLKDYL